MKTFNIYAIIGLLLLSLTACEEYLDKSNKQGVTEEEVYSDYTNFKGVVDRANNLIHDYVKTAMDWDSEIGVMSDEMQAAKTDKPMGNLVNGGLWQDYKGREIGFAFNEFNTNNYDHAREPAGEAIYGIRAVNLALENIDNLVKFPSESEIGHTEQELKDQLMGQCYFLRAWFYFEIIKRYGPMPNMQHSFSTTTDFDVVRPTYLESSDWAVEDLDKAIALLPTKWESANDLGRATKTTAQAVKALVLLYAASPNMNPDLNPTFNETKPFYNKDYAKLAAEAALVAIESAESPTTRYTWYTGDEADYQRNWLDNTSSFSNEAIFQPPTSAQQYAKGQSMIGSIMPSWDGGWAVGAYPTHNATEWFGTADGYPLRTVAERTVAENAGSYDPEDPYANRDPRLYFNIFYHGADMYDGSTELSNGNPLVLDATTGSWHDKKVITWTGYAAGIKLRTKGHKAKRAAGGLYKFFPFIRMPELYLIYAEAANEAYGPNGTAPGTSMTPITALEKVRTRFFADPSLKNVNLTDAYEVRQAIYTERAVEFYSELHRWHDIRRWRIAKDVFKDGIYAADVRVDATKPTGYTYGAKVIPNAKRVYEDKHYWYPFYTSDINMFANFKQNYGW